ncbi:glycosyltransferase [Bifidobacterium avesanii]|nr:glycosyltransferase [Bifidobacterium avesanii]
MEIRTDSGASIDYLNVTVLPLNAERWATETDHHGQTKSKPDVVSFDVLTAQGNGTTTTWYESTAQSTVSNATDRAGYVHVAARSSAVRLRFHAGADQPLGIDEITVNPRIPFAFNAVRALLVAGILAAMVLLRPGSELYRMRLFDGSRRRCAMLAVPVAVQILLCVVAWQAAGGSDSFRGIQEQSAIGGHDFDWDQYANLADALIHGHTNLSLEVPPELSALENPYDAPSRYDAISAGMTPVYWDHAYYQGKYYSYFGVIPAIIAYMPYQLITGKWLVTSIAVLVFAVIVLVAAMALMVAIARSFFPETASVGATVMMYFLFTMGTFMMCQVTGANFYSVPGLSSMMFTLIGLSLWISAKRPTRSGGVSSTKVFLGSLCMACNLGCRPQFVLACALALPLFWNEIVHKRLLFSKRGLLPTVMAIVPFFLVFLPLLAYNYARFGSFLDFGSNYNLTGFDMTNINRPLRLMLPVAMYYLIQPPSIQGMFPFFSSPGTPLDLWAPNEPAVGGVIMLMPALLAVLLVARLRKREDRTMFAVAISCLVLAAAVVFVDAEMCGYSWRYYLDFTWLLLLPLTFVVFSIDAERKDRDAVSWTPYAKCVMTFLVVSLFVAALAHFGLLFMTSRYYSVMELNPVAYFQVADWFLMM